MVGLNRSIKCPAAILAFAVTLLSAAAAAVRADDPKVVIAPLNSNVTVGSTAKLKVTIDGTPITPDQSNNLTFVEPKMIVRFDNNEITGLKSDKSTIFAVYKFPDPADGTKQKSVMSSPIDLIVTPRLRITLPTGTLVIGGQTKADVLKLDDISQPEHLITAMTTPRPNLAFHSSHPEVATITEVGGVITAVADGDTDITVTLVQGEQVITSAPATVSVRSVDGVANVKVTLQTMDDGTVDELFGHQIAKDFYVVQLTLFNDTASKQSLMVFCDTLEAHVVLEKKYIGGRDASSDVVRSSGWTLVDEADYTRTFNDLFKNPDRVTYPTSALGEINILPQNMTLRPGETLPFRVIDRNGKPYDPAKLRWQSAQDSCVSVNAQGIVTARQIGDPIAITVTAIDTGQKVSASVTVRSPESVIPYQFRYRPYGYQVVIDSAFIRFDRQKQGEPYTIFSAMATVVSFLNGADVALRGSTTTNVLDKFSNLLMPGLQKLFHMHDDEHVSNLTKHIMKPIEEIPFGSSVSKLLIFPKRPFKGIVRGHWTRISAINPDYATVDVALIKAKQKVGTGSGNQNQPE